ncbi:tachykinins-like [Limulus polyphemus]|uniref:Tachykinins-like n=1 Tax=Limulus polyphemus TaxID=6850 RepID=A0ABM1BXH5_LIMPO|nr:tachykinins-like [Limulus polyphemus]
MEDGQGKREDFDEKRASPFFGLRGKRDFEEKRASPFFGLRGKKDFEEKRDSPFFGLRGRREDIDDKRDSPFFGLRGKKFINDYTEGKRAFHALRGKKDESYIDNYIDDLRKAYEERSTESRPPFSEEEEEKRAEPFYGLRGKRSLESKESVELN